VPLLIAPPSTPAPAAQGGSTAGREGRRVIAPPPQPLSSSPSPGFPYVVDPRSVEGVTNSPRTRARRLFLGTRLANAAVDIAVGLGRDFTARFPSRLRQQLFLVPSPPTRPPSARGGPRQLICFFISSTTRARHKFLKGPRLKGLHLLFPRRLTKRDGGVVGGMATRDIPTVAAFAFISSCLRLWREFTILSWHTRSPRADGGGGP
jgi:hypothetical protein